MAREGRIAGEAPNPLSRPASFRIGRERPSLWRLAAIASR